MKTVTGPESLILLVLYKFNSSTVKAIVTAPFKCPPEVFLVRVIAQNREAMILKRLGN
jgi:hypothetical protein